MNITAILVNLSATLIAQGTLYEAEKLLLEANSINQIIFTKNGELKDDLQIAQTYNNLAIVYIELNKNEEALPWLVKSLDMIRRLKGSGQRLDGNLAATLGTIARAYNNLNRRQEALPKLAEALKIEEEFYGVSHPQVSTTLTFYGDVLRTCGRPREAVAALRRGIAIADRVNGNEHDVSTLETRGNLGLALQACAEYEEALEVFKNAVFIAEQNARDDVLPRLKKLVRETEQCLLSQSTQQEQTENHSSDNQQNPGARP